MTHLSLFSGIGGLDLAAEWAGFKTVLFCEQNPYCQKVLAKHWPGVPIIDDIRSVSRESVREPVTVVSGGFPCQPFSTASHGRTIAEDLSGEFVRCVGEIRPEYAIGENVSDKIIDRVCQQLRNLGYRATTEHNSAYGVGADHIRHRWWAIAYPNNKSEFLSVLHAKMAELQKAQNNTWNAQNLSRVFRVSDGVPNRVDRLKALGNAVVPQQAYPIFKAIANIYRRA